MAGKKAKKTTTRTQWGAAEDGEGDDKRFSFQKTTTTKTETVIKDGVRTSKVTREVSGQEVNDGELDAALG